MENNSKWYRGKLSSLLKEVVCNVFSIGFIKAVCSSFAYYIHEQVLWRNNVNHKGSYRVHSRASLRNPKNIFLGENVRITMDCCIWAGEYEKIEFGDNVLVGPGVKIFASNHGSKLLDIPMVFQERVEKSIIIGSNVWIGANSVIVAGVRIGEGTIVAAGSVVTKNMPSNVIVGGVPASIIKERSV